MADARVRIAVVDLPPPPEARVPRRLDIVGRRGGHVRVEVRRAQRTLELHRLACPLAARLVDVRNARVVVAGSAREMDVIGRAARKAADVTPRVPDHRPRDLLVPGKGAGEEDRAVRVAVVRRLAEVEDDDPGGAALRCAAPLLAEDAPP